LSLSVITKDRKLKNNSRYRDQAHFHFTHKRRQAFYAMPQAHWQMLSKPPFNILETLSAVDDAIDKNADIAESILQSGLAYAEIEETTGSKPEWQGPIMAHNQEKAHSTLRQLFREWSAEGASEREACFTPVIDALNLEYPSLVQRNHLKILIPGAGLGRLVFELCRNGYGVEGNEISYHQILASNHILNFTQKAEEFELYPFVHEFSNHLARADQFQMVLVPDVHPGTELEKAWQSQGSNPENQHGSLSLEPIHPFNRLSYSSADFCIVYAEESNAATFDAVTTVFFIDTAPNLIRYINSVHNCLKEDGVWVNLGPLKWHFDGGEDARSQNGPNSSASTSRDAGIAEPGSVELTEDEVIHLVETLGFKIEKHEVMNRETGYITNQRSMWHGVYRPSLWIARKTQLSKEKNN
jgi:carnosine N-methyltransferase